MVSKKDRKEIFDAEALNAKVEEIVSWSGYSPKTHPEIFALYKAALTEGRLAVQDRFENQAWHAGDILAAQSWMMDALIINLVEFTTTSVYPAANPTTGEQISVVAIGGYGRQEMAPWSDLDLMFLVPYKITPHTEQVVEFILYFLWDLGLTVGHATRNVDEAIRLSLEDMTIRTTILEARYICGDKKLYKTLWKRFTIEVLSKDQLAFVDAKLAERGARHERQGDTRYVLEPNIKQGKGGLRDLQTLFWIAKYLYQAHEVSELVEQGVFTKGDAKVFHKAENFLWTVRCHLHYLAGRPEERLTFDVQIDLGKRMGYRDHAGTRGVERFMKHYFLIAKDVGDLTRILCAVLEEQHKKKHQKRQFPKLSFWRKEIPGFELQHGRLSVSSGKDFTENPILLLRLFKESLEHKVDIHPRTLHRVRQKLSLINNDLRNDPEANACFMDIVLNKQNPEKTLMMMNESGVFGRFIPDFGRVVAQMQYDMYHVYTVDEHTIRALAIVHRIGAGDLKADHPVASHVISEVQSRRVLYLAVMLHDIAKGRKGDHAVLGAEIALQLCPRLGLTEWETETVSWLVDQHLLMSRIAFKRDLDDPQTVADFVEVVQSPERLRLLLILTVADIRAVGPKVWNAWKAGLLRELYYSAQEVLSGNLPGERQALRIESAKSALRENLKSWDPDWVENYLGRGREGYWSAFDAQTMVRHAEIAHDAETRNALLDIRTTVEDDRDSTEIIIYAPDHAGMFASITGALALSGASIVDAKIVTFNDGMAIDTFWVQNERGKAYNETRRIERMKTRIRRALQGEINPATELEKTRTKTLASRTTVFGVPPRVLIDNSISSSATVIEINGRDRLGLLFEMTSALTALRLQITSAHISTYGERVVDVFYVKDAFGLQVSSEARIKTIRQHLLDVIAPKSPGDANIKAPNGVAPQKTPNGAAITSQKPDGATTLKSPDGATVKEAS